MVYKQKLFYIIYFRRIVNEVEVFASLAWHVVYTFLKAQVNCRNKLLPIKKQYILNGGIY